MATLTSFISTNFGVLHGGISAAGLAEAPVTGNRPFFAKRNPANVSGGAGTTAAKGTAQSGDTFEKGSQAVVPTSIDPRLVGRNPSHTPVGHKISFGDYLKLLQREETLAYAIVWYVSNYLPGEMGGKVSLSEDEKAKLVEEIKTFFHNIVDPEENIEDPAAYLADCRRGAEILLKNKRTPEAERRGYQITIYATDFFQAAYDHLSPKGE